MQRARSSSGSWWSCSEADTGKPNQPNLLEVVAMRPVVIAGTILTAALWAVVATRAGLVQAAAFMFALSSTAVTVGLAIAVATESGPRARLRAWGHHVVHPRQSPLCSACSRTLARVGDVLLCASCDGAAVEAVR